MSVHFSHGGPGGYKTSHAILQSLDVVFKTDRFYFTNVDGLSLTKLIPTFSSDYSLSLADQFQLYNVRKNNFYNISLDFSLSAEQIHVLMRYCPYWLPIGSFVLLDEVQLFYPVNFSQKDFTQNFEDLPAHTLNILEDFRARFRHISGEFFDQNITAIKRQFSELYSIPLDSQTFDSEFEQYFEKKILYRPKNLQEFFSMHRHWGFDFELTCQDLGQVSHPIQHVAEGAHYHKNMSIVSSFYSDSYRTYFHSMLQSSPARSDLGQGYRIDKRVFQCYKSTSFGSHFRSRVSQNIFGSAPMRRAFYAFFFVFVCILFSIFWGLPVLKSFFSQGQGQGEHKNVSSSPAIPSSNISTFPVSRTSSASLPKTSSSGTFSTNSSLSIEKNNNSVSSVFSDSKNNQAVLNFFSMKEQFSALEIFVNGFSYSNYEYTYAAFVRHSDGSITKFSKLPPLFRLVQISTCFYSLFWRNFFIKYVFCYSPSKTSADENEQHNEKHKVFSSFFTENNGSAAHASAAVGGGSVGKREFK